MGINFCDFLEVAFKWPTKRNRNANRNVTILHPSGSKITRVPLDVLSTELSKGIFSFKSVLIFVFNFYSGVNFCGEKICGSFILWELMFVDREKTHKNRKN